MEILIQLGFFAALLMVGFFWGRSREKAHFEDIRRREKALLGLPARVERRLPPSHSYAQVQLVSASVVIANDFFKSTVAGLKNLFGGRLTSYESLMDRARREAVLRVKEKAQAWGAEEIYHLRIETTSLDQLGVEIMAFGTAVKK